VRLNPGTQGVRGRKKVENRWSNVRDPMETDKPNFNRCEYGKTRFV
jgi:hypothetical protein